MANRGTISGIRMQNSFRVLDQAYRLPFLSRGIGPVEAADRTHAIIDLDEDDSEAEATDGLLTLPDVWKLESIVAERVLKDGRKQFAVVWEGTFPILEKVTWEVERNFLAGDRFDFQQDEIDLEIACGERPTPKAPVRRGALAPRKRRPEEWMKRTIAGRLQGQKAVRERGARLRETRRAASVARVQQAFKQNSPAKVSAEPRAGEQEMQVADCPDDGFNEMPEPKQLTAEALAKHTSTEEQNNQLLGSWADSDDISVASSEFRRPDAEVSLIEPEIAEAFRRRPQVQVRQAVAKGIKIGASTAKTSSAGDRQQLTAEALGALTGASSSRHADDLGSEADAAYSVCSSTAWHR